MHWVVLEEGNPKLRETGIFIMGCKHTSPFLEGEMLFLFSKILQIYLKRLDQRQSVPLFSRQAEKQETHGELSFKTAQ